MSNLSYLGQGACMLMGGLLMLYFGIVGFSGKSKSYDRDASTITGCLFICLSLLMILLGLAGIAQGFRK